MAIYILLIFAEIAYALFVKLRYRSKSKQEYLIAKVGMILVFLLLALKADTVGIDVKGYKHEYQTTAQIAWNNFSFVYYEKGYVLLMKLFAKLGIPFQVFTMFLYGTWCHSVYLLIRKYSPNALLSILILIGYSFLTFSISGLRQTLAMALCLYVFFLYTQNNRKQKIGAVVLLMAAVYIHESAMTFLPVLIILQFIKNRPNISLWAAASVAILLLRSVIWTVVFYIYGKSETSFSSGGNLIFLLGMVVFISYTYYMDAVKLQKRQVLQEGQLDFDAFAVRAVFLCLICYVIFSGGTMLRANMYYTLFFIPSIPRSIKKYPPRTRFVLELAMGTFMVVLFYQEALMSNQMQIWPYRFFWQ